MTLKWDPKLRKLSLSVRDLAETGGRRFGSQSISMTRRANLGRLEHERVQAELASAHDVFHAEFPLKSLTKFNGYDIEISGRIDALYQTEQKTVIEEIKTVIAAPEQLRTFNPETFPEYTRQLLLYQYLLDLGDSSLPWDENDQRTELRLAFVALPSQDVWRIAVPYSFNECKLFVENRLREFIANIERQEQHKARRIRISENLKFPFPEIRPQQHTLMAEIDSALEARNPILVSAATGIGKSVSALYPALRAALAEGGRIFVATSKTTQQQIFKSTLEQFEFHKDHLNVLVLTARDRICQNEVVLCHPDACSYAKSYEEKVEQSGCLERVFDDVVADRETFVEQSRCTGACPFFMSVDAIADADVIIGDYNYVFDPGATLRSLFVDQKPTDLILIIDEAHNVVDRGRGYYSPELSRELVARCFDCLDTGPQNVTTRQLSRSVSELNRYLLALEQGREEEWGQPKTDDAPPEPEVDEEQEAASAGFLFADPELLKASRKKKAKQKFSRNKSTRTQNYDLSTSEEPTWVPKERCVEANRFFLERIRDEIETACLSYVIEQTQQIRPVLDDDPILTLQRTLTRVSAALDFKDEAFSTLYSRGDTLQQKRFKILCKDPSGPLGERIQDCRGVIAISATLEPFDFYHKAMGFPDATRTCSMPSPFPQQNRLVLVDSRISTRYRDRDREFPRIIQRIRHFAARCPGNVIAAFPSYALVHAAADALEDGPWQLIVQRPRMSDQERREVLEILEEVAEQPHQDPVLLLTVQGGIFTEGVDYPGDLCVGVVLVGPALPGISFERRLIQAYFDQQDEDGFAYTYLYPGMNRVIQTAGRCHRRSTDKGAILLIGRRFTERSYATLLPSYWYQNNPRELESRTIQQDLEDFWDSDEERARLRFHALRH